MAERLAPLRGRLIFALNAFPLAVMAYFGSMVLTTFWLGARSAIIVSLLPAIALMARSLTCEVVLAPQTVRIRNFLHTMEIPTSTVRGVRAGQLLRWTTVPALSMLVVKDHGRERRIPVHATISFDPDESVRSLEHLLSMRSA